MVSRSDAAASSRSAAFPAEIYPAPSIRAIRVDYIGLVNEKEIGSMKVPAIFKTVSC